MLHDNQNKCLLKVNKQDLAIICNKNVDIKSNMYGACLWNNLHQGHSKPKDWKAWNNLHQGHSKPKYWKAKSLLNILE